VQRKTRRHKWRFAYVIDEWVMQLLLNMEGWGMQKDRREYSQKIQKEYMKRHKCQTN